MNVMKGNVVTVLAWILFAAGLLYVKDRREKAYWQDVTDKIVSQLEPGQLPKGEHEPQEWDALASEVVTLEGPAPAGVKKLERRPTGGAAVRSSLQDLKQFLGVSP